MDVLNPIALVGWFYVAVLVATTPAESLNAAVNPTCFALEAICLVEVARMAMVRRSLSLTSTIKSNLRTRCFVA